MEKTVDARGQACPQPVILTKKALQESDQVITIVDNETARENVRRLATKEGCQVTIEEKGEDILLHISKTGMPEISATPALESTPANAGPLVTVFASDQMGRGSDELGTVLMRALCHTLTEVEPRPDKLVFFNSGVKLTVKDSPVLEDLEQLAKEGVEILVCGTCLQFFEIKDQVAIGEVPNMYTIAETLLSASKTVTI